MKLTITVDDSRIVREMNRIVSQINTRGRTTMNEIAELAKLKARLAAPRASGKLREYIIKTVKPTQKDYIEVGVGYANGGFGPGNPHREKKWRGEEFSLPAWMHSGSPRVRSHPWKNGKNPEFLVEAKKNIQSTFYRKVNVMIRDVVNKK